MEKINNWTILYRLQEKGPCGKQCVCRCACGRLYKRYYANIKRNKYCWECSKKTHGLSRTPLYFVWAQMKGRCSNPKNQQYKNYGARGIFVCQEWQDSYKAFYDWAVANGYKKGLTIDRINNNDGYYPENCRWCGMHTQNMNRRYKPSKTGIRGVYLMSGSRRNKYDVQIGGRRIGYYKTLEEAVEARDNALKKEEFAIFI